MKSFVGTDVRERCLSVPLLPFVPFRLKALKPKGYLEEPQTLGEHLKKRRLKLCLVQAEAARAVGVPEWTYRNWEADETHPYRTWYPRVIAFLGYDPNAAPRTTGELLKAARRALGLTQRQAAKRLGWWLVRFTDYELGRREVPVEEQTGLAAFLRSAGIQPASVDDEQAGIDLRA